MADPQDDDGRRRFRDLMGYGISALIGSIVVLALGRTTVGAALVLVCLGYLAWVWLTKRPPADG